MSGASIQAGGGVTGDGYVGIGSVHFSFTGSIQLFTAPTNGIYAFEAAGGQGGTSTFGDTDQLGGLGALASGDLFLSQGTVLDIVGGGVGRDNVQGASGGGGSFVYTAASVPEPGSLGLLAIGLLGLGFVRFRRRTEA